MDSPQLAEQSQSTTQVQIRQPVAPIQLHLGFSKRVLITRGLVHQGHCFHSPPDWQHTELAHLSLRGVSQQGYLFQ